MYIALVGAGIEENLALAYLVPPLRAAGHEVQVFAYDDPGQRLRLVETLRRRAPQLVGMSVAFQHRVTDFRDLARALRSAGVTAPVVWGGHIPTARAGQILESYAEVDIVVRHDAEQTMVELADALATEPLPLAGGPGEARTVAGTLLERLVRIDGLAFRLPGGRPGMTEPRAAIADLDTLDPPARDLPIARHAGLGFAPILGSRGCWQSCTYCSIQSYHRGRSGPRVRFRSPDAIAAEMAELYERHDARIFCFHDENFFLPRPARTLRRLGELRAGLDRHGVGPIGIVAKARPDELSPELLREARRMGLMRVYIGIENGSQNGLDHLGRETDVATCARALDMLRDAGVYACFNVLLFEPDTTLADVADNLAFLKGAGDFPWNFCRAEVYPGAFLEERLRLQGRLRGGLEGMTYTIADPAAETLFRITAIAFGGRNFGTQSTANAASGVGYIAALLERFFPGRDARAYARATADVLRRLHEDTLHQLTRAYEFVAAGPRTPADVRDFAAHLAHDVAAADAVFWAALDELRTGMDRYGRAHAPLLAARPTVGRSLARAAAIVAAVGAMSARCDGGNTVDPVPPDVTADIAVSDPLPPDVLVADPLPPDVMVSDPPPPDVMVSDPPPPDVMVSDPPPPDVMVADPLPPDVMVADPPPPDVMVADPPPPDIVEYPDVQVVDPLPPDIREALDIQVVDPPPPDVFHWQDVQVVDPLPPDVSDGDAAEDVRLPPVDPPPPDMNAAAPGGMAANAPKPPPVVVDPVPADVRQPKPDRAPDPFPGTVDEPPRPIEPVDPPPPPLPPTDPAPPHPEDDPPPPDQRNEGDGALGAEAIPLGRYFRVRLDVSELADGDVRLRAHVSGATHARLEWRSSGGHLEVSGVDARFRADGSAPPVVTVTAESGTTLLDVARYLPDRRREA